MTTLKLPAPVVLTFALLLCPVWLHGQATQSGTSPSTSANPNSMPLNERSYNRAPGRELSQGDKAFLDQAARVVSGGIKLGGLADRKAANDRVNHFGQLVVADFGAANAELLALAQQFNYTLPRYDTPHVQQEWNSLRQQNGNAFDQSYISYEISEKAGQLQAFQQAIPRIENPQIKGWAEKMVTRIKQELAMAREVAPAVGAKPQSQNSHQ